MHRDDSGPAFPVSIPGWGDNGASGMTLRDYFATAALVAIRSTKVDGFGWKITGDRAYGQAEWTTNAAMQAEAAYKQADAMLAARAK